MQRAAATLSTCPMPWVCLSRLEDRSVLRRVDTTPKRQSEPGKEGGSWESLFQATHHTMLMLRRR